MALTEALIAMQVTKPVLGVAVVPRQLQCESADKGSIVWNEFIDRLAATALIIEEHGGTVCAVKGQRVYFEADAEIDSRGIDAQYFGGPDDFQADMEDSEEGSMEIGDSGNSLRGYEISGDDWAHVEAIANGEQPDMDEETSRWLEEVGLIKDGQLTSFGQEWVKGSVDKGSSV